MIIKSLTLLLVLSLSIAQEQAVADLAVDQGNATEVVPADQAQANATEAAANETEQAPIETEAASTSQEADWEMLRSLIGPNCAQDVTSGQNATGDANSTSLYSIPAEYKVYIDLLGLNFDSLRALNTSADFLNWDIPTLKSWVALYLQYHNAVIGLQQDTSSGVLSTIVNTVSDLVSTGLQAIGVTSVDSPTEEPSNWNSTVYGQIYDFSTIWLPEYDGEDYNATLQAFQTHPILYETFAFAELTLGQNGIMNQQQPIQEQQANDTTTEEENTGFLQDLDINQGLNATVVFPAIDQIIKDDSLSIACSIANGGSGEVQQEEQAPIVSEQEQQLPEQSQEQIAGDQAEAAATNTTEAATSEVAPAEVAPVEAAPVEGGQ